MLVDTLIRGILHIPYNGTKSCGGGKIEISVRVFLDVRTLNLNTLRLSYV